MSLRAALGISSSDLSPMFNEAFTADDPGQVLLVASSQDPSVDNAHILSFTIEPITDKSSRVYCAAKRAAYDHSDPVTASTVYHTARTDVTNNVGSEINSWVVKANDETKTLVLGNQVSLLLGGTLIRSAGTGGEITYRLGEPRMPFKSSLMDYHSDFRLSVGVPVVAAPFFLTTAGVVMYISRDEGVSPSSTGTFDTFTSGQENWLATTAQLGLQVEASVGIGIVEFSIRGDGKVGGYADARGETLLSSFSQPRMIQPSHDEWSISGWRRFWGWWFPSFTTETVLDPIEPAPENKFYATIVLQQNTNNESGLILSFDIDLGMRIFLWSDSISLVDLVYQVPLADAYAHGSIMLTNERDYIHATGFEDSFSFMDNMQSYDGMSCIENSSGEASSMRSWYDENGALLQEAMSEEEMVNCFDGDVGEHRPEPNNPTDPGDLAGGWINTINQTLNDLEPDVLCVKDEAILIEQGVHPSHIFLNPRADPENPNYDENLVEMTLCRFS